MVTLPVQDVSQLSPTESESVVVGFRGADRPGEYRATLRIVTQAMNAGVLSAGQLGEPPIHLHYLDIPLRVRVGQ